MAKTETVLPHPGTGDFAANTPVGDMRAIVLAENLLDLAPKVIDAAEALVGISGKPAESSDQMLARMRQEAINELLSR